MDIRDAAHGAGTGARERRGSWRLPHRPEAAGQAREICAAFLRDGQVDRHTADQVLLVVSELVTNAVEHARPPLTLSLRHDSAARHVRVEVTDGGPAGRHGEWAASCSDGEHGRGLHIIGLVTAAHGDRRAPDGAIHWADLGTAA